MKATKHRAKPDMPKPGPTASKQTTPVLALAVQYPLPAPLLPRWRLRRWVQHALNSAASALTGLRGARLTLRLVDEAEGRQLNHDFRHRDYATNVLTFEYGQDDDGIHHGDIVLCLPVMRTEAQVQGKSELHHAAHLVVHGTLHALGFDHETDADAQRMQTLETRILAALGITDPYR